MTNTITIYDYEDWTPVDECMPHDFIGPPSLDCYEEAQTLIVPAHFEVCSRCQGKGTHVNPNVDGHGLSREDFDQDPDFERDYFGGVFDVKCAECKGERVVLEPNWDQMTERQKELANAHYQDEANHHADVAAERRVGA